MENNKRQVGGSSSSSSFTMDLFGPKDPSSSPSSSSGLFGSVFGPPSTGLPRDSSHTGAAKKKEFGNQYGNGKHGNSGNNTHNKSAEPCYFSSSIYYGGQEVYNPTSHTAQTHASPHNFKKDGKDDDSNGSNSNSASRGNWWQGSLYY